MKNLLALFLLLLISFGGQQAFSQVAPKKKVADTLQNSFGLKEKQRLGLRSLSNPFYPLPDNVKREVEYDAVNKRYIIRQLIGDRLYAPPQYLTVEEYQRLVNSEIKRGNWRELSDQEINDVRKTGVIPTLKVNSKSFERIFGGTTIDIQPRGEAELTFLGRINKNENPLFNQRQRVQGNFDFNQRIQMDVVGNIGTKLKINMNYNTEAQFDFENQVKLDYTGGEDDIIQKIEAGNVSLPLNTTLINGTQALFGVKTQLKFGKLNVSTVFTQQKSQSRQIQINNGAQQNEYRISADNYEANKHYFLAQYFRDNYNKTLQNPPTLTTSILITKIEVWITNKNGNTQDSRDVLGLIDLGENKPYNNSLIGGQSTLPSGFLNTTFPTNSNNLLQRLPADARLTNSNSVIGFFAANGGTDNYAKLTYARKLTEREYTFHPQLGYISLNNALNSDEVLSVAYRYTFNGVEYQVGEFSTDVTFDQATPKVLYTKLLKNETTKINLPTWDLMMKNIYAIGGYQISRQNFRLDIFRIDEQTGVEKPLIQEGEKLDADRVPLNGKQWIQVTGLDRLNQQQERKPDGVFDFQAENKPFVASNSNSTSQTQIFGNNGSGSGATGSNQINFSVNTMTGYITIDPLNGRIIFPLIEPFGTDLAAQFLPTEQALIDKYTFTALYDSTKVIAQQLFSKQNRYIIKGSYQSEISSEFSLNSINVPEGSVRVFAGTIPLQEGADFTVDYQGGRVRIINPALLSSGQPIRITTENNELFGLQQRSLFGTRLDYKVNNKLNIGGTLMNLTEKPLTAKVNVGEEPISNTMWGMDLNYSSPSRFLTKMVDKIPFISTKAPSSFTFSGEFAQLIPGHPSALNFGGQNRGTSYLDDFEASRSVIDLKSAVAWQLSGTPQLFPESQLVDNLAYGYNRARIAFYNIDPVFYNRTSGIIPSSLINNRNEQSNHYVRQIIEQEVFPFKETSTGQALTLPTLDVAFYPTIRGPYNFATTGFNPDGTLRNPKTRWGGLFRRIETNDFEALNIEYIELWVMDPFIYKTNAAGGDLYFNIGNISEDILKDGRKSLENGLPANGDPSKYDETNWGRVPKLQPVVQAFDNDPAARRSQDVGLDGLSNVDEKAKFGSLINQIKSQLNPDAAASIDNDPSSDDYVYFRGRVLDQENAGILKRYERFNGTEGNSKTAQQSIEDFGVDNSASTSLPDGEDINRDNNMTQSDEYFQYKVSIRPGDLVVGQKFVTDKVTSTVALANGQKAPVTWYQIRIPLDQYQDKVGGIQDFKSIRFIRMFMTNFADTTVLRFGKIQLVRGEWRQYNSNNEASQVILDPALQNVGADNSTIEVSTVNIEENGKRTPIPYVVPPGIERERDFSNYRGDTRQNEQALALTVKNLRDGYGRATFKTAMSDFRSYKRLEMFVHLEALGNLPLNDNDLNAFLRIGTDNQDNYYQYSQPLKVTRPGTSDPYAIWPDQNKLDIDLTLFQQAKLARNKALDVDGLPWNISKPFPYIINGKTIIVKGQPDMSKVRVYMLGVINPAKNNAVGTGDDGLDKSAQVWFNELRLTEFDERGGWAATARMSAKLADFADVNISGSKSTVGFGSLEKRVSERNRADNVFFDISSSMELGKFLPQKTGVKIPMFVSYSSQVSTPQYDPKTPDIELKNALDVASKSEKKAILEYAQDYTTRSSINFTNVRKERTNPDKKPQVWDVENFNASYAYTKLAHRDFIIENNVQQTYRASLAYNYSGGPSKSIEPFRKIIKSNTLALLKDVNFSLLPSSINFRIDVDRYYSENNLRNNDPNNSIPIRATFNKNFLVTRVYGISWNLTKSLTLDFDATNYSIIDEPDGKIEGLKRDTLWQNMKRLGRTTDYTHNMNISYNLPINKIPGMDWVTVATRYGTNFNWQTEPLSTLRDPLIDLGNTIQNSRTIQLNPTLNLAGLYNKFGFVRRANKGAGDKESGTGFLVGLLTSVKNLNAAYTKTQGIFLPGYLPKTSYFGIDNITGAPGLGFVFGSQRDIREMALNHGWITRDTLQSQLYINTLREDISITGLVEPIRDLSITLTANKNRTLNYSTNFRYDRSLQDFQNLSPFTTGDYSVSFISLGTAFSDKTGSTVSTLFNKFMDNRQVISQRLGAENPNSSGTLPSGYANGYDKNAQDVIVSAFLAAYTGKDASSSSLNSMPKIPLPNWRINYRGLTRIAFLEERFSSIDLRHSYRSVYSINGFNSLLRYQEANGAVISKDENSNFLPKYQYAQVTIAEQFAPLIGVDTRLKNNMTVNFEMGRTRLLGLSLANSQLAQMSENNMVFGLGYRTTKFRFPFGLLKGVKTDNNMDFKLDIAIRDNKTVIYRADILDAEVSSGAKNITFRPSVDYILNQRFNVRLFYDSNITKPYTSQTFNTSFSNFGFSLRVTLN
ncbi:cell surface protein SprA [Pedobacter sp. MC2016-24]|uniref:T9SS outer membrane translocon Sov/SprA n=1 Tax=Pedobacter sp. MC2016-24 TaxID=2780090 RepID=UPI001880AF8F|nr:cell surface protein SprA [Pedobacter sp. MC2016-24]MBE9599628.1 cell surface protein SprA [Pedobacter sp. MC2016-24]